MRKSAILGFGFVTLCVLLSIASFARADNDLPKELNELDRMRAGKNTPLQDVENRGEKLLKEHASPEERGQIYYHLADVYGQSGMVHPELVIENARHSLQFPISPSQRLRLYIYLGDALVIENEHSAKGQRKSLPEIRKMAVVPYLEGLKDAQNYQIPRERPRLPGVGRSEGTTDGPDYQEAVKRHEQQMVARERAMAEQRLWDYRAILSNQIVELYARKPYAATELRHLGKEILADPTAVDGLMKIIAEKGALSDDPVKTTDPPRAAPPPDNRWPRTALRAGAGVLLALLVLAFWFRRRYLHGKSRA